MDKMKGTPTLMLLGVLAASLAVECVLAGREMHLDPNPDGYQWLLLLTIGAAFLLVAAAIVTGAVRPAIHRKFTLLATLIISAFAGFQILGFFFDLSGEAQAGARRPWVFIVFEVISLLLSVSTLVSLFAKPNPRRI